MLKRKCLICKKKFYIKEFHAKKGWGKFCSVKCRTKGQLKGEWFKCGICGKKIWRTPKDIKRVESKVFFCSVSCHCTWENKYRRCGENAANWVSGQTVYRRLLERSGVLEKCRICGNNDKRVLVVHHRDTNRRNNKPENLEWLCRNCHCVVHYP